MWGAHNQQQLAGPSEQLPMPCSTCGAPMRERPLAHGSVLECWYCGQSEPLPAQAQARVEFLRARLKQLSLAKARVSGLARAVTQGWHINLLSYGFILIFVGGQSLFSLGSRFDELSSSLSVLPREQRAQLLAEQVWWHVAPIVMIGGLAVGYLVSFAYARIKIRPLLLARAPAHPGAAMSCRCCGGQLPLAQGAFVDCGYCTAQNLVTGDMAQRVALAWERETAGYGLSLEQAAKQLQSASKPWIFWVTWGLMIGLSVLVPQILMRLFL